MIVPNSGMLDLVAMQNALCLLLADEPRLALLPVLPEVKLYMESDLMVDAIWTLPRSCFTVDGNGVAVNAQLNSGGVQQTGAGILVEMPVGTTASQNVREAPTTWEISIVAFEERNSNLIPATGTGMMSEQACQIIKDSLQLQQVFGLGCLKVKSRWFEPAHDWMGLKPGIIANRVLLEGVATGSFQTPRTVACPITFGGGNCTITCSDVTAAVFYTTDGTIPVSANASAKAYTAPFAVQTGDRIMAAARTNGKLLSEIFGGYAP